MSTFVGIGDFARMTLLSVKALRHYHDVGLLEPAEVDPETGYRRYRIDQIPTAQVIRRLRDLGMPLDGVRAVIHAPDVNARNEAIAEHLRRMEGELEQTRSTVQSLRLLLDASPSVPLAVAYREEGPSPVLAIRDVIAYDDMVAWLDDAFAELHAAVSERAGVDGALFSPELMEDEFGEIVAVVPGRGTEAGRARALELSRVEYAVAVHTGSLDDVDLAYAALGAVVADRAIGLQGPLRENYLDDGRIEVCWPVFQTAT
jgi:DNA-binding transcriptional MerR regulator